MFQVFVVGRDELQRRRVADLLAGSDFAPVTFSALEDLESLSPEDGDSCSCAILLLEAGGAAQAKAQLARFSRILQRVARVAVLPALESGLALELASLGCHETVGVDTITGDRLIRAIQTARARNARDRGLLEDADRLRSALRSRSRFVGVLAHELKNALNSVTMFSELLWGSPALGEESEERSWLRLLRESVSDVTGVLEDLLDLAKVERGQLTVRWSRVSPRALLERVTESYRITAGKKGLDLRLVVEDDCPDSVYTDPPRLRQVLVNLLSNALKFTETGRVEVRAAAVTGAPDDRESVAVTVSDTGMGISASAVERIFEEFWQSPDDPTNWRDGSGLGLFISRRIVELLGGTFAVRSQPGKGSDFTIELPARPQLASLAQGEEGRRVLQG